MRSAALLASCLLLGACGTGSDTKRVEAGGVSLLVPADWRVVDAGTALSSDEMRAIESENPEFGEQLRQLEHPAKPIKLLAFAPRPRVGSINVFVFRADPGETATRLAGKVTASLRAVPGFRVLGHTRVQVAGSAAEELRYVVPYRRRRTLVRLQTRQVLLIRDGREYAVTYTGDPKTFAAFDGVFRKSIATLRVGDDN